MERESGMRERDRHGDRLRKRQRETERETKRKTEAVRQTESKTARWGDRKRKRATYIHTR